ncbi:dehydrogenase [Rufibacter quisquiliarum]|uniref:D-glycero-alpha-D-manno-heptose-7-phosphate kinase n=1 Tax=Rufibacter quisquiliarum TaxID=1549639 RepID=A0A839GWW2_9BACT|nr:dehydrogenase [Rufibacter quisquiliarum]MBA9079236.1 D-glycero-alpha-D-manno-heptose-7-phosphate kinase [Rufibacter quisquiliarum]
MIIRSKAPLRLGLAGGGTDVSPYSDQYGGAILNATINKFAYATLIPLQEPQVVLKCYDIDQHHVYENVNYFDLGTDTLRLIKGIHNRIKREFKIELPLYYQLETYVDAPPGSGLGSSSTLVVAIVAAFAEWLGLPLGEYDIAQLAYSIEREDLGLSGGKQDQYAATFGGFNFMEFHTDRVVVNPLRIKEEYIHELEFSLLQYYTGTSRLSSKIIDAQVKNVNRGNSKSVEAMHALKGYAFSMKEALLRGKLEVIGELLHESWLSKKNMADEISNPVIDEIYEAARENGAIGGKMSGAGGGGYMMFYVRSNALYHVRNVLQQFGGQVERVSFYDKGVITWKTKST